MDFFAPVLKHVHAPLFPTRPEKYKRPVPILACPAYFPTLHPQHTNMQLSEMIGSMRVRRLSVPFTNVRMSSLPHPLYPQGVCEPAARTKLQLLNCTQWTEQFLVGKEAINSGDTVALELLLLEVFTACPKSHTLTLLSRPPEASRVPSALKARLYTVSVCPRSSLIMLPADKSHRRMRRSSPADTKYWPSGEIARSLTEPYEIWRKNNEGLIIFYVLFREKRSQTSKKMLIT